MCTDALPVFSAQSGRRVWGRSAVQHCASSVFWETPGQSCAHARIECGNPVPTPGLRIECGNPVPTPGLTVGRVNGEKNTPEAMLRGQHRFRTFGAGPVMGFSAKYRSRNPDLGGRIPTSVWRGLGRAPMPGRRGREAGMWRARRWASPYSLGEPVRAIKRGWGEPSNEVGASHQTRLGEPVLRGRWASQYSLGSLGKPVGRARTHWANHSTTFTVACACSARLVKCLLGTASCSARSVPTSARSARLLTSARSALCLLGTFN